MLTEIKVPEDEWEDDKEVVVSSWFIEDGEEVSEGELLVELMVEKVQFEIVAPTAGVVSIQKQEDEVVRKGTTIATIKAKE